MGYSLCERGCVKNDIQIVVDDKNIIKGYTRFGNQFRWKENSVWFRYRGNRKRNPEVVLKGVIKSIWPIKKKILTNKNDKQKELEVKSSSFCLLIIIPSFFI